MKRQLLSTVMLALGLSWGGASIAQGAGQQKRAPEFRPAEVRVGRTADVRPAEHHVAAPRLTEFGAERAGNADGSIPPYEGGGVGVIPIEFKPGSGRYPDPFKNDKMLASIDAKTMQAYGDQLSVGTKALLERFPNYRVNVYPSRRTMSYPDWVLKNTAKNATSARLTGTEYGDGVQGASAGIPFPAPKDGHEVMWNQMLRYQGARYDYHFHTYFVDGNGRKSLVGDQETVFFWPYYSQKPNATPEWSYYVGLTTYYGPPSQIGIMYLQKQSVDQSAREDTTWAYTPGQRRVRIAPDLKYDTPAATVGGALLFDEINGFSGRMDRFDFKLVGKREMLIPYNNYRAFYSPDLIGEKHENPDVIRWEKHRVWVVEATLKPGKRHIYSRRTYYIDEDTWMISLYEAYDQAGKLHRVENLLSFVPYDKPRVGLPCQIIYDLSKGSYAVAGSLQDRSAYMKPIDVMPETSRYTPEVMLTLAIR